MAIALRIAHLHTQLQLPADTPPVGATEDWLRELSQRPLAAALAGVAERALSRAGLPPEAVVAVRRLDLRLKLAEGASDGALLQAWSQALEQALVLALGRTPLAQGAGNGGDDATAPAVAFADAWAAETAHLGQLLRWGEPAWWAQRLLDGRGEPLDLAPAAILRRWIERHPARAAASMAALAERPATRWGVGALLTDEEARPLAQALALRLSQRPAEGLAPPEPGTALRALLEAQRESLGRHRQLGCGASAPAARLEPWRLAALLHAQPSLAQLSAATLRALAEGLENPAAPAPAEAPAPTPRREPAPSSPAGARVLESHSEESARQTAWIHAGGLLLLLNHPALPAPSSDEPPQGSPAGDLALLALQRLLAPLGAGERAAALQREWPLLALLAPDRAWPERLDLAEPLEPAAAERHLALLLGAIPDAIGFAPGALRQVYGPAHGATPPLPDRASHRLAALLWRPGLLAWDDWEISLSWPLASVDGALRREGWDLDPGWQPALRRVVRFHYGAEPLGPGEETP